MVGTRCGYYYCTLTRYTLIHSVCDLIVSQMNVRRSLIRKLMLYEFKLSHNAVETTKNICCVKGEGTVDPAQMVQEISLRLKERWRSSKGKAKSVLFEVVLQAIDENPACGTWRISGDLSASHTLLWFVTAKTSVAAKLCPTLLKYCNTFDSSLLVVLWQLLN